MLLRKPKPSYNLPGWKAHRGYDLVVPESPTGELLIVFHGFTHDGKTMRSITSPNGRFDHPESLDSVAKKSGIMICYPNGTPLTLMPGCCWNGGGGLNGFAAVAKKAVDKRVDDIRYIEELLTQIRSEHKVVRVYLSGISNGAALAHRFAGERPDLVDALGVVAGCHQHAAATGVGPSGSVPLLHIHGTADPIWAYQGGDVVTQGRLDSVDSSLAIWAKANHADLIKEEELCDHREGELKVFRTSYEGSAPLIHVHLEGGGHTWPGGRQYLPESVIGKLHHSYSANRALIEFFRDI